MAYRFQRRVQIMPGVRLNISKSGLGMSVGPRGASVSVGKQGIYRNIGIPGTGLSMREKLNGPGGRQTSHARQSGAPSELSMELDDDGTVSFFYDDGSIPSAAAIKKFRDQNAAAISEHIQGWVDTLNQELNACLSIHMLTPAPVYQPLKLLTDPPKPPMKPQIQEMTFWDKIFFRHNKVDAENNRRQGVYKSDVKDWNQKHEKHQAMITDVDNLNAKIIAGDIEAQARAIEIRVSEIAWAKPTSIDFDFGDDATTLALDIDLPRIDQIPSREALTPTRGLNIRWKTRAATQLMKDFSYLAHASLFRVAGEAFACLPAVNEVTVSVYTQRIDPAIGDDKDVYVLSVRINREDWEVMNFDNLAEVDVEQALARFELVRNSLRSGELKEIKPFS
ncbi:MAG: DUF4236 domain-containing protein [Loktanella sp.]|nr:DUF4236 domain-containing protein [Loktanella sp.]